MPMWSMVRKTIALVMIATLMLPVAAAAGTCSVFRTWAT